MNAREKKLAVVFGAVLATVIVGKVIYPSLVSPMFQLRQEVDDAEAQQAELEGELRKIEDSVRQRYHEYVLRTSGTDPETISRVFFDSMNALLRNAQFGQEKPGKASGGQKNAITPRAPSVDRKTGVATISGSVTATGTIAQCVDFIRGFYELPYVARFSSIKLTPTPDNQQANHDEVKLNADVEVLVLPHDDRFGNPDRNQQAPEIVWVDPDVHELAEWRPFTEFRKPVPTPTDYVDVTPTPTPHPTPPPAGAPFSPNATEVVLRACSGYGIDEVLLVNVVQGTREYVAVGGAMDAGELVLVDAWGAVVHKATKEQDFGYFIYPIGDFLAAAVKLEEAAKNPELQFRMRQYLAQREISEREKAQRELVERERQGRYVTEVDEEFEPEVTGPVTDDPGWMEDGDDAPPPPFLPTEDKVKSPDGPVGPFDLFSRRHGVEPTHPVKVTPVQKERPVPRGNNGPRDARSKDATRRKVGRGAEPPVSAPDVEKKRNDEK